MNAAEILSKEYGIDSDIWSVTSFNELRKDGMETERWNLLNPDGKKKKSYVEKCLEKEKVQCLQLLIILDHFQIRTICK